jgi:hypothetical protein
MFFHGDIRQNCTQCGTPFHQSRPRTTKHTANGWGRYTESTTATGGEEEAEEMFYSMMDLPWGKLDRLSTRLMIPPLLQF